MRFRIDPDTKDALLFTTGLLGMIAQGVLAALQVPVSPVLIGAFLMMMGIATGSSFIQSGSKGDDDDGSKPPSRRKGRNGE